MTFDKAEVLGHHRMPEKDKFHVVFRASTPLQMVCSMKKRTGSTVMGMTVVSTQKSVMG